jgi:hypothetical protein
VVLLTGVVRVYPAGQIIGDGVFTSVVYVRVVLPPGVPLRILRLLLLVLIDILLVLVEIRVIRIHFVVVTLVSGSTDVRIGRLLSPVVESRSVLTCVLLRILTMLLFLDKPL